jgi:Methyltransferase domain
VSTAAMDDASAPWKRELLFRSFDRADDRNERLLQRVKAIYDPVFRCDLSDADVGTFLSFLYLCVRMFQPNVVVQTGTATGASSVAIALGLRDAGRGVLYTIDPEPPSYFGVDQPVALARRVVERSALGDKIRFVQGYSTMPLDAGRMFLPSAPKWRLPELNRMVRTDMLVVDGDHTFLGCYLDLVYGAAGLASGGPRVIVCHDYLGIPDVRRAVRLWRDSQRPRDERLIPSPCGIKFFQM